MIEIKGVTYKVTFDPDTMTVTICGVFRLYQASESEPIIQLFDELITRVSKTITLNLRQLEVMNSFGFSVLTRFMIKLREKHNTSVVLQASERFFWQRDLFTGLQRLLPELELEWK